MYLLQVNPSTVEASINNQITRIVLNILLDYKLVASVHINFLDGHFT